MEIELNITDIYRDELQFNEVDAILIFDAEIENDSFDAHNEAGYLQEYSQYSVKVGEGTIFITDKYGGDTRSIIVDPSEIYDYISDADIMQQLED